MVVKEPGPVNCEKRFIGPGNKNQRTSSYSALSIQLFQLYQHYYLCK